MLRQFKSVQMVWLVGAFLCATVSAQNPSLEDVYLYGGAGHQRTLDVGALSGNVYLSGYNHELGHPSWTRLVRIDGADGSVVWWGSPASTTIPFAVLAGPDPEIYPEPAGKSNTGNTFRFDSECGCYIYNLSTKGYSAGTYSARVTLDDGGEGEVIFSIR